MSNQEQKGQVRALVPVDRPAGQEQEINGWLSLKLARCGFSSPKDCYRNAIRALPFLQVLRLDPRAAVYHTEGYLLLPINGQYLVIDHGWLTIDGQAVEATGNVAEALEAAEAEGMPYRYFPGLMLKPGAVINRLGDQGYRLPVTLYFHRLKPAEVEAMQAARSAAYAAAYGRSFEFPEVVYAGAGHVA